MNTAPFAPGDKITTDHTCAGELCTTPIEVKHVVPQGSITADFRLRGTRCDGSAIEVYVRENGEVV